MKTRFLLSAFAAAALLSSTALATSSASAATPPNVLVVAQSIDDIVSLDPAEGYELTSVESFNSLYQRLIEANAKKPTQLDPVLASSWKAAADGQSVTFELRKGATFASGNPVRPEDVIFSLSRALKLNKSPVFILETLGWTRRQYRQHRSRRSTTRTSQISWPAKVGTSFALSILSAPDRLDRRREAGRCRTSRTTISAMPISTTPFSRQRSVQASSAYTPGRGAGVRRQSDLTNGWAEDWRDHNLQGMCRMPRHVAC